jgi:CubicO group peptidase (beta-lactamase class C family)
MSAPSKKTGLLSLVFLLSGAAAFAAPDEDLLGKADGYPLCPFQLAPVEPRCMVGLLSNFDKAVPARTVAKGTAPRELKRAEKAPELRYTHQGQPSDVESFLGRNRNTGLLVMKGDTILVERYQYERKPEHRFQSYSMAKTVVAMLVGIALQEKAISSIDDKAEKYLPVLKDHPYGQTTLRHLLTMSSGVKFREDYDGSDDVSRLARSTLFRFGVGGAAVVLPFTERAAPAGQRFSYASAESQVLAEVVRAATNRPLADYLSEKIWQPMGAEADATWLLDGGGHELGFMGLNATLRDWGRLGMLLANDGALDGRQIIPAEWVRAATTAEAPHLQVGVATKFNGYGYQTWLIHPKERMFALLGVRGQGVFIDPSTKTVVVHTAVHASPRDTAARAEQFSLFFGAVNSAKNPL